MRQLHPLAPGIPHPAPLRHLAPTWLVLSALFAAPFAWGLQLLVSYMLIGDQCSATSAPEQSLDGATLLTLGLIGLLAIAVAIGGLATAWRIWRLTCEEGPGRHHETLTAGHGRTRFLGLCGIVGSLTFLAAAIFEFLVPFLATPCALPLP